MGKRSTRRRLYGNAREDRARDTEEISESRPPAPRIDPGQVGLPAESCTDQRLYGLALLAERHMMQPGERLPVKVLIVDDHPILREGVVSLLRLEEDLEVVGEAANGKEALDMVRSLSPDVVLMDLMMPEMNGLEAVRRMRQTDWSGRVLVLSQYDDEPNIVASMEAGAASFIPKRNAGPILVEAIRAVSRGEQYVPPYANGVRR